MFEFEITRAIPIGLTGDGQRPMHTVLSGRVTAGSLASGDVLTVFLSDASTRQAFVIGIMLATEGSRPRSIGSVSAERHRDSICYIAIRLPPKLASLVNLEQLARSAGC